jgi:NTE family protein
MKIGLALGGGGAKGFAHIPYIKAIEELGIKISFVSGTSMGAIIGAFYAAGMTPADMIALVESLGIRETIKLAAPSSFKIGLTDGKNVEKFLSDNLPVHSFEELKIPLKISATEYWSKKEYVFKSGELVPAIRASISLPGIFQPFLHEGKLFLDGGIVNPVPFDLLSDADFIITIDVLNENFDNRKIPGPIDALFGSYHIMKEFIMKYKDYENKAGLLCSPDLTNYSTLAFHKSKEIISSVEKDVEKFKEKISVALDLIKP